MDKNFKSGFVALIGRPNVGKSTLMNQIIGQKIAITSKKPQTTRNKIQTVYTCDKGQIVFLDTPGIHKAKNKLGEYMVNVAEKTLKEVDLIMWLVEPDTFIGAGEQHIAEQLKNIDVPVILVINKTDTVKQEEILISVPKKEDIETPSVLRGRIDYYNESKGYGFIKDLDGNEKYFFHVSNNSLADISENDIVTFDLERGLRGMNAINISLENESENEK